MVRSNTLFGDERTYGNKACDLRANSSEAVTLTNNILVGRPGQTFSANYQPVNAQYAHNLFYGYTSVDTSEMGSGNIIGKNLLLADASLVPGQADFRVRAGSPAAGLGANLPATYLLARK